MTTCVHPCAVQDNIEMDLTCMAGSGGGGGGGVRGCEESGVNLKGENSSNIETLRIDEKWNIANNYSQLRNRIIDGNGEVSVCKRSILIIRKFKGTVLFESGATENTLFKDVTFSL